MIRMSANARALELRIVDHMASAMDREFLRGMFAMSEDEMDTQREALLDVGEPIPDVPNDPVPLHPDDPQPTEEPET